MLKKFFWTLISFAILSSIAYFAITIIAINTGVASAEAIMPNSNELLLTMILAKTVQVAIFYVLAKRKKSVESNSFLSFVPMLVCLIVPLLSILSIFFVNDMIHNYFEIPGELIFVVSIGYLAMNVIVYVLYEFLSKEAEKNYLLVAKQKQYELTQQHNNQVIEIYEKMREWKHDFMNHMQLVSGMLEKTDSSGNNEAISYIKNLNHKIESSYLDIVTGNLVVDAIVSAKATVASANDIRFEHNILLKEDLSIDSTDLCSILSNLLDNAIEACRKLSENKYIDFEMIIIKNQLSIKITNASGGDYKMENGKMKTTKSGYLHGIGMGHVKSIVENYGGIFEVEPKAECFTANISIPLSQDFSK
ncbi:MAG: GHKL domain-containing protein [Oscillospiraceae bacterium]|nr:GHKL domain-containing protein [Oscillospiraceae bacterium]